MAKDILGSLDGLTDNGIQVYPSIWTISYPLALIRLLGWLQWRF